MRIIPLLALVCAMPVVANAARSHSHRDELTITSWAPVTGGVLIDGATTAPSKATTTDIDSGQWRRVGREMELRYTYAHSNSTGATDGSGTYLFTLPDSHVMNSGYVTYSTDPKNASIVGSGGASAPGTLEHCEGFAWAYSATQIALRLSCSTNNEDFGSSFPSITMGASSIAFSLSARVPIAGWHD